MGLSNCYVVFLKSNITNPNYGTIYKWNTTKSSLIPVGGFTYPNNGNSTCFSVDPANNYLVFGYTNGNTLTSLDNYSNVSYMYLGCDGGCN